MESLLAYMQREISEITDLHARKQFIIQLREAIKVELAIVVRTLLEQEARELEEEWDEKDPHALDKERRCSHD